VNVGEGSEVAAGEKLTLTVPEAARLLGISRVLAYELVRQGKIPALRFGRRLLIPRVALMRLLAGDAAASSHGLDDSSRGLPIR